jgi:phosphoglycolate phosphatase
MNTYKTIIFDMDGTVLDTLDELTESLNYILRKYQLTEKTKMQVRSYLGYGYAGLIRQAVPGASQDFQQELQDAFKNYYGTHCQGHTKPYEGILEILASLRDAGYKTAIVSNKGQAAVTELHKEFFEGLVQFSLGESANYKKKPEPDMIWEALRRLDSAAQEAIYIGDSEVDKKTADNSGLDSALVTWGFRDKPLLQSLNPDYLVSSPKELEHLFIPAK